MTANKDVTWIFHITRFIVLWRLHPIKHGTFHYISYFVPFLLINLKSEFENLKLRLFTILLKEL